MKNKISHSKRLTIPGNSEISQQEFVNSLLKQWLQKLGYCSIFAAVPAILASHIAEARSDEPKAPAPRVAEQGTQRVERLNISSSSRALLKRQSRFRLPHQTGDVDTLNPLAGNDNCPGRTIAGGNYTVASPYVDSGDTTGANDTVTRAYYLNYTYYNYDAFGPDHIYSFTLTARGPNPKIEVSTSSSTYKPMVYVLKGGTAEGCPAGTGNHAHNELVVSDSRWGSAGTATLSDWAVNILPLNVPLYLVVDSAQNDANGSGTYTIRMQDVTIGPAASPNPIDSPEFFVRQHYLDFLAREPEQTGLDAWLRVLRDCPSGNEDCLHQARLTTSESFFGSPEFRLKGFFVFRFYRTAFGRLPEYNEIATDLQVVTAQTPDEVYAHKAIFTAGFVNRQEFAANFAALSNADYVSALLARYGLTSITTPHPAQPDGDLKVTLTSGELVSLLNSASFTRAQVLRAVVDSDQVLLAEFNPAFVAMQYYGYLRRTPEQGGFQAWLAYLSAHPQDVREMVRGFVDSVEYRARFGTP